MSRAEHVRTKHNPLLIRRESDVGLKSVVVFRQVHKLLRLEIPRLHELLLIRPNPIGFISHDFGPKQINPLSVSWRSNAVRSTSVTSEQCPIRRDVEVDGPFTPFEVIPDSFTCRDLV